MKVKQHIKAYLIILIHVIIGLAILVTTKKLPLPSWVNVSVVVLFLFLLINIVDRSIFKLKKEFLEFWNIRKMHYLFIGIIGGAVIGLIPEVISIVLGIENFSGQIDLDFSISAILIALVIVAWEELWFRGIFLNYCNRILSPIDISITIGALFMLMHVLNPKVDLLVSGPALFFAGALLTILYFSYRTIWLPIGLHFGNNFFGSAIEVQNSDDVFLGTDGYLGAIVLALLFAAFAIRMKKTTTSVV